MAGAVAIGMVSMGCSNGAATSGDTEKTASVQQLGIVAVGTTVTPNKPGGYAADESITASWSSAPGGGGDWVALAKQGTPDTAFVTYAYTGGTASGSTVFAGPAGGSYELRYYTDNSFNVLARSGTFTVAASAAAPTITTNPSYPPFSPITVTFGGLPGNSTDWIAISDAASADTSFINYKYTGGAKSGTIDLDGVPAGTYVARAYENNTYTILKQSVSFTVAGAGAATLAANKGAYTAAESATAIYTGLGGSASDWIAIARPAADVHDYVTYQYTGGGSSGSKVFDLAGLDGSYVFRAFSNNTFNLVVESSPFTVGVPPKPISTDSSSYAAATPIKVAFNGLPGNTDDWISISVKDSPDTSFVTYQYTNGAVNGEVTFNGVPAGTYVARSYSNNTYTIIATSDPFTVGAPPPGFTTVSTNGTSYTDADTIQVTYGGMSGSVTDWVSISLQGSAPNDIVAYQYTGGNLSGTLNFSAAGLAGGTYVARAYYNNSFTVEATSAPAFTVTPAGP